MILRGPRLQMEQWVYQGLRAVQGDGSGDACHLKNPRGTQDVLSMAMQADRESYTKDCPVQRRIKNECHTADSWLAPCRPCRAQALMRLVPVGS
jgi:hypothetical protein